MNPKKYIILGLLMFVLTYVHKSFGQENNPIPLNKAEISEVVDSVTSLMEKNYVFPDIAKEISSLLKAQLKNGVYDDITNPQEFASQLTKDIQSVNNDRHLRVNFNPEMIQQWRTAVTPEDSLAIITQQEEQSKKSNYGFKKVEILEGNIGYLKLDGFFGTENGSETATAAMNYLANGDALIIDLRENGGGSPSMIQLISSYLFDSEPIHLNSFYWRPSDRTTQTWTLPYVPGKRRPDMPVYVLTSGRTFSAAEEFSYNLQNLERATLVGETTGGGAHPGGSRIATDRFTVWIATGRAINPITNTNWEGTGVIPHMETKASMALDKAHILALQALKKSASEEELGFYDWAINGLKAKAEPVDIKKDILMTYAGTYGPRKIFFDNGVLSYQREDGPVYKLKPMSDTMFYFDEIPYFRLKVIIENGKAIALQGLYQDGRTDRNKRDDAKP